MKKKIINIFKFVLFSIAFIILFSTGVYNKIEEKEKYKNYAETDGIFTNYEVYASNEDGTTYTLTYTYYVRGERYSVSTNYGTSAIPKNGTKHTILYKKDDPTEAIITGTNYTELLFFGSAICLTFLAFSIKGILSKKAYKKREKLIEKIQKIMLGTIMSYMGILVYALITGTKNIFSVLDMFLVYGLVALLPLIFVVIGFYMILLGLGIIKEKKDIKKTTFELEQEELKKQVLDAKIDEIEEVVEQVYIRTIKFTQFIPLIFLSIGLLFLAIKAPSLMFRIIVGLTWLTILFIYLPYFIELKRSKDKNVTPKIKKKRQKIDKAVSYLPFVPIILIFIIMIVWQIYSS